ncbi:nesprin-1-like [Haliotis rubra]|uniref:nesprin-1-like n=1 Tax=Haliotis rubra TaxID=36100 RepID=UPI001EE4EF14|nr:nesprin-1-like [Haliotis rubra]
MEEPQYHILVLRGGRSIMLGDFVINITDLHSQEAFFQGDSDISELLLNPISPELCGELGGRQEILSTIRGKSASLVADLPVAERDSVKLMALVQTEHDKSYTLMSQKTQLIHVKMAERQDYQVMVDKLVTWLEDRERTAERSVTFRLLATDVDKQAEKCKSLCAEVQSHMMHLEPVKVQAETLKAESGDEMAAAMDKTFSENVHPSAASKCCHGDRLYRTSSTLWLQPEDSSSQTVSRLSDGVRTLSCSVPLMFPWTAVEVLQEQMKTFRALQQSSEGCADLLAMTIQRGEGFYTNLYETDRPVLDKQLSSLPQRFNPISTSLSERVLALEVAVQSQTEAAASISQTEVWLKTMQAEMQQVPLGASVEDAEDAITRFQDLEQKLAGYQTSVSKLNETVSVLRTAGQTSQAEAVLKVTSQYEQLIDQVCQHQKRCRQMLQLRQQFLAHITDLENSVRQCQDKMAAMTELGVDVSTRIERYREIKDKLVSLEPDLFVASDQVQQMAIDNTAEDDARNKERVQAVRDKVKDVLTEVDSRKQQCEQLQQEREDFEEMVGSTIAWLEQKEDILASRGALNLDSVKVNPVLSKHQTMSSKALERLSVIREKAEMEKQHYDELQEVIPVALNEKLSQIHSLEDSIKDAIEKKEQYLVEAKADRVQYENSMRQVTEWLHGAEDMLDSGYDGLDYDTINNTLSEYTDYFSEASLCQDEMEQVMELSDKLLPTLDTNDKTTLQQSLTSTNKKLVSVISTAQSKQEQLEIKASEWKVFQAAHQDLHLTLEGLETQMAEVDKMAIGTPQDLELALHNTKNIQTVMESQCRPAVDELNDHARSLDRVANSNSRSLINKHTSSINSRWNTLVAQMEAKLLNVQETGNQWTDYASDLEKMEVTLQDVQDKLDAARHARDADDLNTYITILQELSLTLSSSETRLDVLQRSSTTLQRSLPTAEARVSSHNSLLSAQEKFERLRDEVRNELMSAREDQEDQQSYLTEITQTMTLFTHTQEELMQLHKGPDQTHTADSLQRYKVLQQDVRTRIQQFHRIVQVQEAKYSAQGKQLPESLRVEMAQIRELEASITDTLQSKEEELLNLREDREQYQTQMELVTQWLTRADATLRKQIPNLDNSKQEHEALLGEIPEFQTHLDAVRGTGSALIQHTPDPAEKSRIQSSLAEVNRQFSATQSRVRERSQHLQEASRLTTLYGDGAASVTTWLREAEAISSAELSWTDFETVNEELKTFQRLSEESIQSQTQLRNLHVTVKQLSQFSDTSSAAAKLDTMAQRVSRVSITVQDRLSTLENTHARIEEYETDIADITRWLEKTRAQLADRDPPLDVKAHLAGSEQLLQELRAQKSRAQMLLQRYEDLRSLAEVSAPSVGSRLLVDIGQLEDAAVEQCEQLQEVVQEQDRNDTEIKQLNTAIGEAQEKLLASPVLASSVDTLKQQIAEHDTLAAQIKTYQARLSQINEKNRGLSERSLQRSPTLVRRRFLMNTSVGSSGFSSAHFHNHSSPHFGYTDSIEDSGAHMSDSLNTMPSSLSWSSLSDRSDRTSTTIRSVGHPGDRHREQVDSFDSFRSQSLTSLRSERGGHGGDRPSPFQPIKSQNNTDKVPPGADPSSQLVELNTSWASLQEQVVAKEKELHSALQQQEDYQRSVQEVTAKMEHAQKRLSSRPPSPTDTFDRQQDDHKETLSEIDSIKNDIIQLQEQSRMILDKSDPEGRKAMEATLTMLTDRAESLQVMASDAGRKLQAAVKDREKHNILLEAYKKRVKDVETWLSDTRVKHATSTLPTDTLEDLQTQMDCTRDVQEEVNVHLRLVSDLAVQCDSLCEQETPTSAEKLRTQLASLQKQLGDFKLETIDKQSQLRGAIKDADKRQREMSDYEDNVQKLQQWMSDTKQMTVPTVRSADYTAVMPERHRLQQDLTSGLVEHRQLVQQISVTGQRSRDTAMMSDTSERVVPAVGETELHLRWEELQKDLAEKKQTLEDLVKTRTPGEVPAASFRRQSLSPGVDPSRNLEEIRQIVGDLGECWEQLQGQVEDRQVRVEQALSFQQQYQQALLTISSWLDSAQKCIPTPSTSL